MGELQKVAIFGAGSEIASAIAIKLAQSRARDFVLAARSESSVDQLASTLVSLGARVEYVGFDAQEFASHRDCVAKTAELLGDIDLAIIAFGVLGDQETLMASGDDAVRLISTNFTGAVSLAIPLAESMRSQGHGTILAISSVAAERPRKDNFVYGSSKAGFDAFFSGLADELLASGVKVVVLRPGFVHTKMTQGLKPAPFSTSAELVAQEALGGIANGTPIIWAPRKLRVVMSVLRHLPRSVFRKLAR